MAVDVAIIGAGPAGLTAGYLLTKAGMTVAIIEKDARYVGGISRTVEHEGYRFDIGGHRFFSKVAGGGRPVERDPAGRFHPAPADEPHLLRGQILLLSAARRSRRCATSACGARRCAWRATPRPSCSRSRT